MAVEDIGVLILQNRPDQGAGTQEPPLEGPWQDMNANPWPLMRVEEGTHARVVEGDEGHLMAFPCDGLSDFHLKVPGQGEVADPHE